MSEIRFNSDSLARLKEIVRKSGGGTVGELRAAQKPLVEKTDKRRLRATGRTERANFKFRPEFKERLRAASKREGVGMGEILERGFELYEKSTREQGS